MEIKGLLCLWAYSAALGAVNMAKGCKERWKGGARGPWKENNLTVKSCTHFVLLIPASCCPGPTYPTHGPRHHQQPTAVAHISFVMHIHTLPSTLLLGSPCLECFFSCSSNSSFYLKQLFPSFSLELLLFLWDGAQMSPFVRNLPQCLPTSNLACWSRSLHPTPRQNYCSLICELKACLLHRTNPMRYS